MLVAGAMQSDYAGELLPPPAQPLPADAELYAMTTALMRYARTVALARRFAPLVPKRGLASLAGSLGIDVEEVFVGAVDDLDALVAPTVGPAWTTDLVNGDHYNGSIGAGSLAAVAGYPHLTVPMGAVEGLPVGVSFMGAKWADSAVLQIGAAYERARSAAPAVPSFERWVPAAAD